MYQAGNLIRTITRKIFIEAMPASLTLQNLLCRLSRIRRRNADARDRPAIFNTWTNLRLIDKIVSNDKHV